MSSLDVSPGTPARWATPPVPVWQLQVDQFLQMVRAGIVQEDDPVELLDGWMVPKMNKNPPHQVCTGLLREAIFKVLPEGWHELSQDAILLPGSVPEPDGAVIHGSRRDYLDRHPLAADVGLIIEVSESSLKQDQTLKKRLYAEAKIPTYWIVNLVDRRVEVYTDPTAADYRTRRDYSPPESIPLILDGRRIGEISVAEILP